MGEIGDPAELLKDADSALRKDNDPDLAGAVARIALREGPDAETKAKLEALLLEIAQLPTKKTAKRKRTRKSGSRRAIKSRVYVVAGTGFDSRAKLIRSHCEKGTTLQLRREPGNKHDPNAIAVLAKVPGIFGSKWRRVGYLPRTENKEIAQWLDAGRELKAVVSKVYAPPDRDFPKLHVRINESR
ncbi:MAG: HIRAN domain-containing protein [Gammaproteobacteria bacterium]|nr:HIRAN domain-containing protein [Gammaproteobacteria bacterium]MDH3372087.1 HIRAN domain-containing protein [Gammaproteobacteria bacterium]MDH3408422.1 HIRAN domain-containing protein [Gammaproteobacteria bacterium]